MGSRSSAYFALEDDTFNNSNETWDQFKVNEEKFGVESSYDEHLYTTRINTAAPDYHTKLRKAEKIAKDIENQTTGNRHVLEERGIEVDDSGIDEEDKYSGVDRRGDELMAALRNANISTESTSSNILNAPGSMFHQDKEQHNTMMIQRLFLALQRNLVKTPLKIRKMILKP